MSKSNDELAAELKGLLGQTGLNTAFDDATQDDDDPLESDFFKAINAFRAARASGSEADVVAAEEELRRVVRDELTGESRN